MTKALQIDTGIDAIMQPQDEGSDAPLILVVDDDADVRGFAAGTLREAGYRVLEAENGRRAVVLFEAYPDIALICTDVVMPGLDGFKLADMTKFKRPALKIVYTTAYPSEAREKLGVVHGAILNKPYRPTELARLVKQALG
jgi:CheY-like chemotaxis protein